jgi:hypothetical protein
MRNLIGGLSRFPQVTKDVIRVNVHPKSTAEHCDKTPGHNNSDATNNNSYYFFRITKYCQIWTSNQFASRTN